METERRKPLRCNCLWLSQQFTLIILAPPSRLFIFREHVSHTPKRQENRAGDSQTHKLSFLKSWSNYISAAFLRKTLPQ